MITVPPSLVPQQGQGLLTNTQTPEPLPTPQSTLLAMGEMHDQGLLAGPRQYNHGAHVRRRNGHG